MSFSTLVLKVAAEIAYYKGLIKDTEGASGIEYAVIAAMVAVVIAGISSGVGEDIRTVFGNIRTALVPSS